MTIRNVTDRRAGIFKRTAVSLFRLKQKLPAFEQVLPVFSTILFIVFSWMFWQFFIQVPSWLFYMDAVKLLIMFAYVVSFSLIECLMLMGFIIVLCVVFPIGHFKEKFIAQGTIQVFLISLITYVIRQKIELFQKFEIWKLAIIPLAALAIILVSTLIFSKVFNRFSLARRFFDKLADRMMIFTYLYLPLGVAGLVIIVIRNLT